MTRPQSFADLLDAEAQQVTDGTAQGCGFVDPGCHGGLTCIRIQHSDDMPHVGRDNTGQYVQWNGPCPPPEVTP